MKKFYKSLLICSPVIVLILLTAFFFNDNNTEPKQLSQQFNNYWHNNEAEITSYQLNQARYGEVHDGKAVLVFVTEPFSESEQVKVDDSDRKDYSVLKLNFTKKFNTGIYPYSIMLSTFSPLSDVNQHVVKVTNSVQEWCGQVFTQVTANRVDKFKIKSFSYFESEGDRKYKIRNAWMEDELWSKIRTNPESLPIGKLELIPSISYTQLMHKKLKAYDAIISKQSIDSTLVSLTIYYPELFRTLVISYTNTFPYSIEGWEETYVSGFGDDAKKLTTKAKKITVIKSAYWQKNKLKDAAIREEIGL